MRCPKCGFYSFDFLDECPKCKQDWRELKEKLGIKSFKPQELNLLEDLLEKVGTTHKEESFTAPVEPHLESETSIPAQHEEAPPAETEVVEMEIEPEVEKRLFSSEQKVPSSEGFLPSESEAIFEELEKAKAELDEMEEKSDEGVTAVEDIDVLEEVETTSSEETEEIEVLEDIKP